MVDRGSMVCRGVGLSLRVLGVAIVGDIGNITGVVISVVVDMLGPAVGKSNRVGSSNVASSILGLNLVESSLGVVISNSVLEGVWLWGLIIGLCMVSSLDRGVVGSGGMVGRGGMDNRGVVRGRGMVGRGSMDSMSNGMSSISVSSSAGRGDLMKSLVVVSLSNGGMAGSEGLGLSQVSHLSVSLNNKNIY